MTLNGRSTADMEYVLDHLEVSMTANPQRYSQCLEAMAQYEKPWWRELSGNSVALAKCQIDQPILLIPWKIFKEGVEEVLGRKLMEGELSSANTELIKDFHKKYQEKYDN